MVDDLVRYHTRICGLGQDYWMNHWLNIWKLGDLSLPDLNLQVLLKDRNGRHQLLGQLLRLDLVCLGTSLLTDMKHEPGQDSSQDVPDLVEANWVPEVPQD
jgi:hypothetical protein